MAEGISLIYEDLVTHPHHEFVPKKYGLTHFVKRDKANFYTLQALRKRVVKRPSGNTKR